MLSKIAQGTAFRSLMVITMVIAAQQVPLPGGFHPRVLLPFCGVLVILTGMTSGFRRPRRITIPPQLTGFVVLLVASALLSPAPWITLPGLVKEVLLTTEFLWFASAVILLLFLRLEGMQTCLAWAGILLAVQQILMAGYQFLLLRTEVWGSFRAPNLVARFAMVAWPFFAVGFRHDSRWLRRAALGTLAIGLIGVLVLSASRMVIVAVIVQAFYLGRVARARPLFFMVLVLGLVFFITPFWGPLLRVEDGERVRGWLTAIHLATVHPLFGIGPGLFGKWYALVPPDGARELLANTHNLWLHLMCELGVMSIPLLCWTFLSAWTFLRFQETGASLPRNAVYTVAARAALIGILLQSLVEY